MEIEFSKLKDFRPRISLRPLRFTDAVDIHKNVKNRSIVRYMVHIPHPYRLSDARAFIKNSIKAKKDKTAYVFGIVLKQTKKIVGVVSLSKVDKKNKNCELGYWLGKKYWNQGIMTLAAKMALEYAFNKLNMHRVYARTFASNSGSLRVLEKNNFMLEGINYEIYWRNNYWHNLFSYGLLKDDYNKKLNIDR
jgi:RimJ/RimL family protein N-acetyltransferase